MTEEQPETIGPDGQPVPATPSETSLSDLVAQPAKVMRIGGMIRQLLDEVKAAPLDEASRVRLRDIHLQSIKELEDGLAPELVDELERLSLPFNDETPSEGELRIAQAQLVGWLEGLFHGIQAALYAQQVQAQAQFQNMRLALPGPNDTKGDDSTTTGTSNDPNGMYL
ncbi:bacterial proteasome activator family protein [Aeromicrobium sp.]|uniref:bacterial proteasome activator family protein n=1 Tax=Aeromicrobium sp. TaxID=1871063 RepID=UPI002FC7553C